MVYIQTVLLELNDTSENKHLEILSLYPNYKLANKLEIMRCLIKILTNQNSNLIQHKHIFSVLIALQNRSFLILSNLYIYPRHINVLV